MRLFELQKPQSEIQPLKIAKKTTTTNNYKTQQFSKEQNSDKPQNQALPAGGAKLDMGLYLGLILSIGETEQFLSL